MDNAKRITLFGGHYGSGKTNLAVNFAINLKNSGKKVSIYDLDIVNPYFRTIDAKEKLQKAGVELVVSPYAQSNVDLPALNPASYKMTEDLSSYAVVDIGGDDRGALALGRFTEKIKAENNYDFLFVFNCFRPETATVEGAIQVKNEIESICKLKFTGIASNCNLGAETTLETIKEGFKMVKDLSLATSLSVKLTAVRKDLADKLEIEGKILPIELIEYGNWL